MTDNPLVAAAHSSTTWHTGLGLVEDATQISNGIHDNSWVDGTLGGVGMVIDPLGSLVARGVSADDIAYLDFQGAVARTDSMGVQLGPAAFHDEETLIRTLGHESMHVRQHQDGRVSSLTGPLEDEAYAAEDGFCERVDSSAFSIPPPAAARSPMPAKSLPQVEGCLSRPRLGVMY